MLLYPILCESSGSADFFIKAYLAEYKTRMVVAPILQEIIMVKTRKIENEN